MEGNDKLLEEIIQLKIKLRDIFFQHYFEYELFSPTWWLMIALIVIPLLFWWRVVDKKRLLEVCVYGLLANMAATFLDILGSDYMLWEYPVHVLPKMALFLPVDYVIVPVVGMVIYQKYYKWKQYLLACIIVSAFMSFICEPIAIYVNMYKLISWRYIYSFPIYIIMYTIIKYLTEKFMSIQTVAQSK